MISLAGVQQDRFASGRQPRVRFTNEQRAEAMAMSANSLYRARGMRRIAAAWGLPKPRAAVGHIPFEGHRTCEQVRIDEECGHVSRR